MFSRLFAFLFKPWFRNPSASELHDFQALNQLAPVKDVCAFEPLPIQPGNRPDDAPDRSVICREAVLNHEQRIAGYEFLLRRGMRERVRAQSRRIHHVYNEVVIRNLIQFSIQKLLGHRHAFVTVLDSFLANSLIDQLPGQGLVLTVMPMVETDDTPVPDPKQLVQRVQELKQQGFIFALEECFEGAHFVTLVPHVSYLIVNTAQHSPVALKQLAERLVRQSSAKLIARELESFDDFQLCRSLGFSLFQGPFVTSREDWTGNQAGPQTLHVCDLLNHLRRDAETAELVRLLKQDAVLSYRLLRYVNSAASGLRQTIASIEHALVLIGREKMYRWLTLLLLGSAQVSPYAEALQENALVRARFMELIGKNAFTEVQRDGLFVIGLFSMLDLVLQMPLLDALKPLNLSEDMTGALLHHEGPYAPFLELTLACESLDQDRIAAAAVECRVDAPEVNVCYFEALAWAQNL